MTNRYPPLVLYICVDCGDEWTRRVPVDRKRQMVCFRCGSPDGVVSEDVPSLTQTP